MVNTAVSGQVRLWRFYELSWRLSSANKLHSFCRYYGFICSHTDMFIYSVMIAVQAVAFVSKNSDTSDLWKLQETEMSSSTMG